MERTLRGWKPSATVSEAFGKVLAATDVGQALLKDYKTNLHRVKQSERPGWIAARAAGAGLDSSEVFTPGLQEAAQKFNVDLASVWAFFLNKYFEEYASTGNPPEFAPYFGQGSMVIDWPGSEGATMPVAIAWLTPYGSKKKAKENFEEAALALEDKKGAGVDPKTVDDLAKIKFMESHGMTSTQIAWQFLAERYPELVSLDEESRNRDYAEEHRRQINRLRQIRNRGLESVTQIVPSLSRFED